jgi:hypothetical protein
MYPDGWLLILAVGGLLFALVFALTMTARPRR